MKIYHEKGINCIENRKRIENPILEVNSTFDKFLSSNSEKQGPADFTPCKALRRKKRKFVNEMLQLTAYGEKKLWGWGV